MEAVVTPEKVAQRVGRVKPPEEVAQRVDRVKRAEVE
jgi:hypothetical protein